MNGNQIFQQTITKIIEWFKGPYLSSEGCPYYSVDGDTGKPLDRRDLIPELDDYVPFFWMLDEKPFVQKQVHILKNRLKKNPLLFNKPQIRRYRGVGLPGKMRHWLWHLDSQDYVEILYGLIELHEMSKKSEYLHIACQLFEKIVQTFHRYGFIRTWRILPIGPTLSFSDSMSGMYIEIAADLARITQDNTYLKLAEEWSRSWIQTPMFEKYGIFPMFHLEWPWSKIPKFKNRMYRAELAKAGTSPAYGLFALARPPFEKEWALDALDAWVTGLYNHFLTKDLVLSHTPILYVTDRYGPVLSTNFAVLDILCDLYHLTGTDRYLDLAQGITDFYIRNQSPTTHLFPDQLGLNRSYIDANTDFAVSLIKFAELTQQKEYREKGKKALEGVIRYHQGPYGFYRDVDLENGKVIDNTVETRFVSLLLKALILYRDKKSVYSDSGNWSLFRDR